MTDILILDGGLGTSLERQHGVTFSHAKPLWSSDLLISDPETLLACQRSFGAVPVDVLLTATYQVSFDGFAATKTPQFPDGISAASVPPFVEKAVEVAQRAKEHGAAVALSVGPYGACMVPSQEYSGAYDAAHDSAEALLAWHEERMRLFAGVSDVASRVGFIALETIPRVDEIVAMRQALAAAPALAALPFWTSCLFPGDEGLLPDGNTAEAAVEAMLDPSLSSAVPWAIGINCTKVWKLPALLRRFEDAVARLVQEGRARAWPALVLYPDGTNGEVYNTTTKVWEVPAGAATGERVPWEEQLAAVVRETQARGQWTRILVGGCCMAGADDIARLRKTLRG